jgi:hypothetical protein
VSFLCLFFSTAGVAYDYPLDSSAIRTAYFIGTGPAVAAFTARYVQDLPLPKSGPHISEIEVRTPFSQVIALSREHSVGYSAQQAEADYKQHPASFKVRITIRFTPTYSFQVPPPGCRGIQRMQSVQECFHDFRFSVSQARKLQPGEIYGVPTYDDGGVLISGDVWFEFNAAQIKSAPLLIEVTAPDGQVVSADFDLAGLR